MFKMGFGFNLDRRRKPPSVSAGGTTLAITSLTNDGSGGLTGAFNGTGTAYWAIYANGTAAQSGATVKAHAGALLWSTSGIAITAGTVGPLAIDDSTLTPGTTYSFQLVGEDGNGLMALASAVSYTKAAAGPTFKGAATVHNNNAASATLTLPANSAGDTILLIASREDSSKALNAPAGYTSVYSSTPRFGGGPNIEVYSKTSAGSEANPALTWATGTGFFEAAAQVYSGVSAIGLKASAPAFGGTTLNSQTITATAGSLILSIFGVTGGAVNSAITIAGTGNTTRALTNLATYYTFLGVGEHGPVSAGVTTARTATISTSGGEWNTATIELKA